MLRVTGSVRRERLELDELLDELFDAELELELLDEFELELLDEFELELFDEFEELFELEFEELFELEFELEFPARMIWPYSALIDVPASKAGRARAAASAAMVPIPKAMTLVERMMFFLITLSFHDFLQVIPA